jgi:hypothetical protein
MNLYSADTLKYGSMSLNSDILTWFRTTHYLLSLLKTAYWAGKHQIPFSLYLGWPDQGSNFFTEFNIKLYDKNSESDYIFFSNIGNKNIFLEKNHNPPFKLNRDKKTNILTLVLSEKKFWTKQKTITPPLPFKLNSR